MFVTWPFVYDGDEKHEAIIDLKHYNTHIIKYTSRPSLRNLRSLGGCYGLALPYYVN
jgi:hypothetical protein